MFRGWLSSPFACFYMSNQLFLNHSCGACLCSIHSEVIRLVRCCSPLRRSFRMLCTLTADESAISSPNGSGRASATSTRTLWGRHDLHPVQVFSHRYPFLSLQAILSLGGCLFWTTNFAVSVSEAGVTGLWEHSFALRSLCYFVTPNCRVAKHIKMWQSLSMLFR